MQNLRLSCVLAVVIGVLGAAESLLAAPVVLSASGSDSTAIQTSVDSFRTAIGGVNNGNVAGPVSTGRREINWDGGGAAAPVLTNMPHDLFKGNRGHSLAPTLRFSASAASRLRSSVTSIQPIQTASRHSARLGFSRPRTVS